MQVNIPQIESQGVTLDALASRSSFQRLLIFFHIYHHFSSVFSLKTQEKLLSSAAPWQTRLLLTWTEFPVKSAIGPGNVKPATTEDKIPMSGISPLHIPSCHLSVDQFSLFSCPSCNILSAVCCKQPVRAFFSCVIRSHCFPV